MPARGATYDLVVATFNIRNARAFDGWNSWPFRRRSTAAMVRHLDADLLGVQEAYACQARYLSRALPDYDRSGRGRNVRGGEWCAVYTRRRRLRLVSARTRWFGDTPDRPGSLLPNATHPRVATDVRVADELTGADFDALNVHLDQRHAANRLRSVEQIVSWLEPDRPTIVMGDINATTEKEPALFATLAAAGLASVLAPDAGGTAHDYRGGTDHRQIDFILVTRHWTVRDARVVADDVGRRYPSDHWPISARIGLRQEGA